MEGSSTANERATATLLPPTCASTSCSSSNYGTDAICCESTDSACCSEKRAPTPAEAALIASWTRIAIGVSVFSILYCSAEGIVSVVLGQSSRSDVLFLFGVDSIIEVASSFLVMWRLLGRGVPLERERKAVIAIGVMLLLLGAATYAKAVYSLVVKSEPESELPSLIVGAVSCAVMLAAWRVKLFLAKTLRSSTLASDAVCSFSCAQMSAVVCVSGVVFQLSPQAWWIDGAASLLLTYYFFSEGRGMVKNALSKDFEGGGCCCE